MSLDRLGRWRLPALTIGAMVVALSVVGMILLLGRAGGLGDASPSPTASTTITESPGSSASPEEEAEAAVRAFFDALAAARENGDAALVEPFVNGTDSSAYLTAAGFLDGQTAVGKASIITLNELDDFDVLAVGDTATVEFTYRTGGYDIDLESGEPLESPQVLEQRRVRADVVRVDGRWLLDRYEDAGS